MKTRILFLVGLLVTSWGQAANPRETSLLKALSDEVAGIAEKIKPSVVTVNTSSEVTLLPSYRFFFRRHPGMTGESREIPQGMGSGILVDGNYVLTNNHVVENGKIFKVKFSDGRQVKVKLVGRDSHSDVAVLKVEGVEGLTPAPLGDSDAARVGDWVMAIGNPLGLELSVTTGIISATGRSEVAATDYADFIQTSAPINPGNSGGPLVNDDGKVIGINTAIISGAQGLGFTIPINMAKGIMQSLIKDGKVIRGYLGIQMGELTPEMADALGLKTTRGVVVGMVEPGTPAAKAGILARDVIVKFGGKEVDAPRKLVSMIKTTMVGKEMDVVVMRNGKEQTLKATIASMTPAMAAEETLGIEVANVEGEVADRYGYEPGVPGVIVTRVHPHGKGAAANLREGDLIYGINKDEIRNVQDYTETIAGYSDQKRIAVYIVRGQRRFEVLMQLK